MSSDGRATSQPWRRPWSPRARASSPPTRATARSRSGSTRSASSPPRTRRRAYRELLFTTQGAEEFISGVILFDETIRQSAADGTPFPQLLADSGIIPGIKVDKGAKPLALRAGRDRHRGARRPARAARRSTAGSARASPSGARRTRIGDGTPERVLRSGSNAHALARYAALCQEAGIVPIVEPEVLMDGDHTIERLREGHAAASCRRVYTELHDQRVAARGHAAQAEHGALRLRRVRAAPASTTVAEQTLRCPPPRTCPRRCRASSSCPAARATRTPTAHLNAMNARGPLPWQLPLLRPRAAGPGAEGVARRRRQRPRRRSRRTTTARP